MDTNTFKAFTKEAGKWLDEHKARNRASTEHLKNQGALGKFVAHGGHAALVGGAIGGRLMGGPEGVAKGVALGYGANLVGKHLGLVLQRAVPEKYYVPEARALLKKHRAQIAKENKEKKSSAGHALVDIAGLGILAKPSLDEARGKHVNEKTKAKMELAGLGTLAGGVAHEHRKEFGVLAKKGLGKLKGFAGKGAKMALTKKAGLFSSMGMGKMMKMHGMADASRAAANKAVPAAASAGKKALTNPNSTARATALAGHTAVGGHAFKPKKAIDF